MILEPFACKDEDEYELLIHQNHVFLSFLPLSDSCDFLLASLDNETLSKGSTLKRKHFAPREGNSFLLELTYIEKGGKYGNDSSFP